MAAARAPNIIAVEQRVYNVEQGLAQINLRLDGISNDIKARGQPQWLVLISLGSFILALTTGIGMMAYIPIRSDVSRIDSEYGVLRESLVSRREHEQVWKNSDNQLANTQKQIEEMKKSFNDIYGPKDAFATINRRLEALEMTTKAIR